MHNNHLPRAGLVLLAAALIISVPIAAAGSAAGKITRMAAPAAASASTDCRVAFTYDGADSCALYDVSGTLRASGLTQRTGTPALEPGRYTLSCDAGQAHFLLWSGGGVDMASDSTFGWSDGEVLHLEDVQGTLAATLRLPKALVTADGPMVELTLSGERGSESWRPVQFYEELPADAAGWCEITVVFTDLPGDYYTLTAVTGSLTATAEVEGGLVTDDGRVRFLLTAKNNAPAATLTLHAGP